MATQTTVRGWVCQFDVGHSGDVVWQADEGSNGFNAGIHNRVDSTAVHTSRDTARHRLRELRAIHRSHGHSWITRYRIRRATVTLTVDAEE